MREGAIDIATCPTSADWRAYIIGFFPFTLIGAMVPLLLFTWHYVHTPQGKTPPQVLIGCLLFGAVVAFWFIRRTVSRQYWRLTDTELMTGMRGKIRYPISSIEKIIVGLPNQIPAPVVGLARPRIQQIYPAIQASALLVIFRDGTLLPLKLRLMANGSLLMDTLVEKLKDRVEHDHVYSEKEIKLLRWADPNAVMKPRAKDF